MGRPLPIRYTINRILHICINNDTLCLSKANIVDYSLLTLIDTKRKKVRFGIIDYVQQYTIDKIFEGKFKTLINRGEVPTIVDPDKYKLRFKRAMKRYFIGMVVQEDKVVHDANAKKEILDIFGEKTIPEEQNSDEENDLNETVNKSVLNESISMHVQTASKTVENEFDHPDNHSIITASPMFKWTFYLISNFISEFTHFLY